jgi:hypothetical protein
MPTEGKVLKKGSIKIKLKPVKWLIFPWIKKTYLKKKNPLTTKEEKHSSQYA